MAAASSNPAREAWRRLRDLVAAPDVVEAEHAFMHEVGLTARPGRMLRALIEHGDQPMSELATIKREIISIIGLRKIPGRKEFY